MYESKENHTQPRCEVTSQQDQCWITVDKVASGTSLMVEVDPWALQSGRREPTPGTVLWPPYTYLPLKTTNLLRTVCEQMVYIHTQEVWTIKPLMCTDQPLWGLPTHQLHRDAHRALAQKNPSGQQLSNINLKIWQSFPTRNWFQYLQGVREVKKLEKSQPLKHPFPEGSQQLKAGWRPVSSLHSAHCHCPSVNGIV